MGNAVKIVLVIVVSIISILIMVAYYLTKTRSKSLNDTEPFKPLIGKTVTLIKPVYLFQEKKIKNKAYPYHLVDDSHHDYQWYLNRINDKTVPQDVFLIDSIPEGATLQFDKAEIRQYGWGGGGNYCLLGELNFQNKTYKIEYSWNEILGLFQGEERFLQAPWQTVKDTKIYKVPAVKY
ncbi:MAG: hypothetical protein ACK5MZ_02165 [Aestuariibaculum sp.]